MCADTTIELEALIKERSRLRKEGNYAEADGIRQELERRGYTLIDENGNTSVIEQKSEHNKAPGQSFLVIFGSGETASTGRSVHEYVFKQMRKDVVSVAIISSPAGFEANVETVHEEMVAYFTKHLANFHPQIRIIYANTKEDTNNKEIISRLGTPDYIVIGPGSPTYAVNVLRDSLLYKTIIELFNNGSSLCLASAAAIAFSSHALPVYEIYKAGHDLHWVEGLGFFRDILKKDVNIVPHYNNEEGGRRLDTSCCYMGRKRFDKLLKLLPRRTVVWGVDEHTALVLKNPDHALTVLGKGNKHEIIT